MLQIIIRDGQDKSIELRLLIFLAIIELRLFRCRTKDICFFGTTFNFDLHVETLIVDQNKSIEVQNRFMIH